MSVTDERINSWAQGPGTTEDQKCQNAEQAVQKAIASNAQLETMDVSVFTQGSYRARTNVRKESDVDLCVCLNSTFSTNYPPGKTDADYGLRDSDFTFGVFKDLVGKALTSYFGSDYVKRGNKAFDVHENSYRVDADVLPALQHRRYFRDGSNKYHEGIYFKTDDGSRIGNWAEQNYQNGVTKNDETRRYYKRVVRIVKRLRYQMEEDGIAAARSIPSFLVECLIWNVPSSGFFHTTYKDDLQYALAHTFNATINDERCKEWGEVNELKYLFRANQKWTREQAHSFLSAAWDYVGFK
jgi:hypothetical protein